jgi:hypothetical protein
MEGERKVRRMPPESSLKRASFWQRATISLARFAVLVAFGTWIFRPSAAKCLSGFRPSV